MFATYAKSKLAQVATTFELQRREAAARSGVRAVALHPGNSYTDVIRDYPLPVRIANAAIARHQDCQPEGARRLRIQEKVHCMSAIEGGDESIEALRARLDAIVFSEPPMLPSVGQLVPRTWLLAMTFLRALRDGRDPTLAARSAVPSQASLGLPVAPK